MRFLSVARQLGSRPYEALRWIPARLGFVKDSNGNVVVPKGIAVVVSILIPILSAAISVGVVHGTLATRVAAVEAVQKRQEDVLERLIRIETILEELRKPR
jgi:hypothetical protein